MSDPHFFPSLSQVSLLPSDRSPSVFMPLLRTCLHECIREISFSLSFFPLLLLLLLFSDKISLGSWFVLNLESLWLSPPSAGITDIHYHNYLCKIFNFFKTLASGRSNSVLFFKLILVLGVHPGSYNFLSGYFIDKTISLIFVGVVAYLLLGR